MRERRIECDDASEPTIDTFDKLLQCSNFVLYTGLSKGVIILNAFEQMRCGPVAVRFDGSSVGFGQ